MAEDETGSDDGRHVATRLEQDNPGWMIMYGAYSRQFVAFPVYPDRSPNSYFAAKDPRALSNCIRETEELCERLR
jgi:hypothetical protein